MRSRLCLLAVSMTGIIGAAGLSQQAKADFVVNLASNASAPSIPNIGGFITITTNASFVGSGGTPGIGVWAFTPIISSGNAIISSPLALSGFSLIPPPNPGDLVGFANPAIMGPGNFDLVSYTLTRTGPGNIDVILNPVQGVPFQGPLCAQVFTGGAYTITVPAPATSALLGITGLAFARRRR